MRDYLMDHQVNRKINEMKQVLIQTAGATGINSLDTLTISQELDQLILFELKNRMTVAEIA